MSPAARRSWSVVAGAAIVAGIAVACTPEGDDPADAATRAALADVGPKVVLPAVDRFLVAAEALAAATAAWTAAAGAAPERLAAQAAWREAFVAWQVLEPMQLGPAGASLSVVGGADLRDRIYAWPTVSACKVDQQTAYGAATAPGFVDGALVDVIGLAALETLLFSTPGENACFGGVDINADGTWAALGTDGVQAARAAYADVLADDLVATGTQLRDAWDPASGDFSGALADAGADGSPYASPEDALDAVFAALFYLETSTKDVKLGQVLGQVDCEAASCPENVEAQRADASVAAVRANLDGFAALYRGGDGQGLDDLLVARGHADVAAAIDAAHADAVAKVDALVLPLEDAATDPDTLAAFTAVKALTDLVKGDLATVLVLQIPAEAAGDAD